MNVKFIFFFVSLFSIFIFSCTHEERRQPAQVLAPMIEEGKDFGRVSDIIANSDVPRFRLQLNKLLEAQRLVAVFDARIENVTHEADIDEIFESELYCKLSRVRVIHENAEQELAYMLTVAHQQGPEVTGWFYQNISNYIKENRNDPAYEVAMGNAFRGLVDDETQICEAKGCVAGQVNGIGFQVNPLDNRKFAAFRARNLKAMTAYANTEAPLEPGDCVEKSPARKPQSSNYDWVNRNWVGSVLPAGNFVFTYDDGPHETYTRQIRDTWSKSGLAQPAFFWLRKNVSAMPDIVRELNQQGYTISSHSERHADLGNLAKATSPTEFNAVNRQIFGSELKDIPRIGFSNWKNKTLDREINQSVSDLSKILGKPVRYFRLPYGSGLRNDLIGERFSALNLDHFFWRVDSLDWQDKNPETVRDRVVTQMRSVKKGIVLFHDVHPQSVAAAQLIIDFLKANPEFKAVPLKDLPGLQQ